MDNNARMFGAVGNGTADDTAAIQAAITASVGKTLNVPAGTYKITSTLVVANALQMAGVLSDYQGGTNFLWAGNNSTPLLDLQGVRDSTFRDFRITSTVTTPLSIGIRSQTITGRVATANKWENIYINGTNPGGLDKGFVFAAGTGGDANNDINYFEGVHISNYVTAAWSIEHTQSKAHTIIECAFSAGGGLYGVTTAFGGGSFIWIGGIGNGNTGADFYLGQPDDVISVLGGNFEGSGRLLETTSASSTAWPVTLQGVRWASNGLNADNRAVVYTHRGPLVMIGNLFNGSYSDATEIYAHSTGPVSGLAMGNTLFSTVVNPFTGASAVWTRLSNNRMTEAGAVVLADVINV